jgi:cytoskeletal protein CcmA (bactofilin family)
MSGEGDVEIRGRFDGEADITGTLVIEESAVISATLAANQVVVRGAVLGDITAKDVIALDASAKVVGNLKAARVVIALGAQIRGEVHTAGMTLAAAKPVQKAQAAVAKPAIGKPAAVATTPAKAPTFAARPALAPTPARPVLPASRPQIPVAAPVARPAEHAHVVEEPTTIEPPGEPEPELPARRDPPAPVIPAIKKGARAQQKKKNS